MFRRDDQALDVFVRVLLDHLKGEHPHLDLPLDIRATAFQRRVWQELRAIPYGDRRSYSEIAEQIGKPKAVRAVANACASNPAALVVPCQPGSSEGRRSRRIPLGCNGEADPSGAGKNRSPLARNRAYRLGGGATLRRKVRQAPCPINQVSREVTVVRHTPGRAVRLPDRYLLHAYMSVNSLRV